MRKIVVRQNGYTRTRELSRSYYCTSKSTKGRSAIDASSGTSTGYQQQYSSSAEPYDMKISLSEAESELFTMFRQLISERQLSTTVRVAGGWVRDKLLGYPSKDDIDIALDNMSGVEFATILNEWTVEKGQESVSIAIIQQNPDKSKHLETVTAKFGAIEVDFVNLRTENYTEDSRIPEMEIGTPTEDSFRRDLTINSLYYNIHTQSVEDFTKQGLRDLQDGIVRTPLPSLITLQDDPLRALRLVRFACRFHFAIADEAAAACSDPSVHDSLATKVSRERVRQELQLMLQHPQAARAVALFHAFGLLESIAPVEGYSHIASMMTAAKREQQQRGGVLHRLVLTTTTTTSSNTTSTSVTTPPPPLISSSPATQLQTDNDGFVSHQPVNLQKHPLQALNDADIRRWCSSFHHQGTATMLVANYLQQQARTNTTVAMKIPDRFMKFLGEIDLRGHQWQLFSFACMLAAAEGIIVKTPGKSAQSKPKILYLADELLSVDLKMAGKDVNAIVRLQNSAATFEAFLDACCETAAAGGCTPIDQSTSIDKKLPFDRLTLGLAIRDAGEHFMYAIYFAATRRLLQKLIKSQQMGNEEGDNDEAGGVVPRLVQKLSAINGVQFDTPGPPSLPLSPTPPSAPAAVAVAAAALQSYEGTFREVLAGVELLLQCIEDDMQLGEAWSLRTPLSGNVIQDVFPQLPRGAIIGEIMDVQLQWKLRNPDGTEEDLLRFLKDRYPQFL